jgi:hypothetical protein
MHYETSTGPDSWAERERRFRKKFESGEKHIKDIFDGLTLPETIEKTALFGFGSDKNHKTVGGGQVQMAEDFILQILRELKPIPLLSHAVPEKYPILRVLQMITEYKDKVVEELKK